MKTGGCFSGTSEVTVQGRGRVPLMSVKVGERLLAIGQDGRAVYSELLLFLHNDNTTPSTFYTIYTSNAKRLSLTANHLIYRSTCFSGNATNVLNFAQCAEAVFADDIRIGDVIYHITSDLRQLDPTYVTQITIEHSMGKYAPLTTAGNVVINDIIVSCYATINSHSVAHASFAPLRLYHKINNLFVPLFANDVHSDSRLANWYTWYVDMLAFVGQTLLPSRVWFGMSL